MTGQAASSWPGCVMRARLCHTGHGAHHLMHHGHHSSRRLLFQTEMFAGKFVFSLHPRVLHNILTSNMNRSERGKPAELYIILPCCKILQMSPHCLIIDRVKVVCVDPKVLHTGILVLARSAIEADGACAHRHGHELGFHRIDSCEVS